jgi:predicted ABC-type ATPase
MDAPELIVVAGPNGAGKSTFAIDHALRSNLSYIGADAIAAELSPDDPLSCRIAASRLFLKRIQTAIAQQQPFVVESTLSGRSLRRFIESARNSGYRVTLLFVFLDSADTCVARVNQRVLMGGHHVPESDTRRRFSRSITNFWNIYRELADFWMLVYNSGESPESVAFGYDTNTIVRIDELFQLFQSYVEHD